jgi:hypothetical protein
VDQLSEDEHQVNRENQRLSRGEALPINSFDDDQAHVSGHQDFMKTASYDQLPPQVKQVFEAHVAMHQQRVEQKQQEQMQMQMMAQGPQGGPQNGGQVR